MSLHDELDREINAVLLPMIESELAIIKVNQIADIVQSKIDPANVSPDIVSYSSILNVRQHARGILRSKLDPVERAKKHADDLQSSVFSDELQPYYPVRQGDDKAYKKLDLLTYDELTSISAILELTGASLIKHANALLAYRDSNRAQA